MCTAGAHAHTASFLTVSSNVLKMMIWDTLGQLLPNRIPVRGFLVPEALC